MKRMIVNIYLLVLFWILLTSCHSDRTAIFEKLPASYTGIYFNNTVEEDEQYNILKYLNLYTGAGVATGDINNDGLTDLYFSGNITSGRLYLNKGNLQFEDITASAGLTNKRWGTGVSMVDINQDGWLDIYICVSGSNPLKERANLLYINNGPNSDHTITFTESAAEYGIADTRQTMHSSFFDYDKDGDLDLFLIVNPADYASNINNIHPRKLNGEDPSTDILYRNDGNGANGHPTFTDVSREAGILVEGYSLGLAISDINQDGWPDIYISNDFIGNDVLYINNGNDSNGHTTFSDKASDYLKHTSYAGMGNDVADFNNDGLVDILVLDMRPEDNKRQKLNLSSSTYDRFQLMLKEGYDPQYTRNTLQLNRGVGVFSEIGFLSGISSTDWSWSALFADYDNDGDKDLFVTNGFLRDLGNLDYINYQYSYNTAIGSAEAKQTKKLDNIKALDGVKLQDYLFENNNNLTFSNRSSDWGITQAGYSHGAVYADLDNDGDLELVVNNMNDEAHIYENKSNQTFDRHFLQIKLQGSATNRNGIGAKISIKHNGKLQFYEHYVSRGYESSVDPTVHFGLGDVQKIDSLEVIWPDGKYQLLKNVGADQVLTLNYQQAKDQEKEKVTNPLLFQEVSDQYGIDYLHREDPYVDFKVQPLLPHMHSQGGPGIAVGDANNDGLEDFYVGGASGYGGQFYFKQQNGQFESYSLGQDSLSEDMGVLFFDADNDNDLDLYVVSGGSAFPKKSALYQDRLYINDGSGKFSKATDALPEMRSSGSCVVATDYDRDGDLDLFVGGRLVPGEYPMPARSYLLRNDSDHTECRFVDVTQQVSPSLSAPGLVTAALWTDYDNDGWTDLLVTGEFMPLRFFHNKHGKLTEETDNTGLSYTSGWWNSLAGGDFDNDGDTDYLAGNLGLNTPYKVSPDEPLCIYANDYDKNGSIDPLMCYYIQGKNYIAHSRDIVNTQINAMRARFQTYSDYAEVTFEESFLPQELSSAYVVRSEHFESSYIENLGEGKFKLSNLPIEAQMSPVYGMVTGDYNNDGNLDVLLAGNSYATEVATGHYDASVGLYLQGDGKGSFTPVSVKKSGFFVDGDAKGMAKISMAGGNILVLVGNNADSLYAYTRKEPSMFYKATKEDAYALITLKNGKTHRHEFYYGASYLSQSSRILQYLPETKKIVIKDYQGKSKEIMHQ